MGSISTGIGLVSGLDIAALVDNLLAFESAGRNRLQDQIGLLQAQQSALLDVGARLLALSGSASALRTGGAFRAVQASSSAPERLAATAGGAAAPGQYTFSIRGLAATHQLLGAGVATTDATPLGLSTFGLEVGGARLSPDRPVGELNGGAGVRPGAIRITDAAGATATIDLSTAITVHEILDAINGAADIAVNASAVGDHFVLTDDSGGGGALTVANVNGGQTADDLGLTGSAPGSIVGTAVYVLGEDFPLSALGDGAGVVIRNGVADFTITARDGSVFAIDLGRIDRPIDDATLLSDLNDGAGLGIDGDPGTADLRIEDRDGVVHDIDLSGATTVADLRARIATSTGGAVTLDVADGERFRLTDTTGGAGLLIVTAPPDGDATVAEALGLRLDDGIAAAVFTGDVVPSRLDRAAAVTIGDVLERIAEAEDSVGNPNGGRIGATLTATGLSITDTTGGGGPLIVTSNPLLNPSAADDLGLETGPAGVAGSGLVGARRLGGLASVQTRTLNGGAGLGGATTLTVTDSTGTSSTLTIDETQPPYDTAEGLLTGLSDALAIDGVRVRFAFGASGINVTAEDGGGGSGPLTIAGDVADALGVAGTTAGTALAGTNLQPRWISAATPLAALNGGRGVGTGTIRITDGLGATATVNIGGSERAVDDILREINALPIAVTARINDNGDGIVIEPGDLGGATAFVPIRLESSGGTAAADLGLIGSAAGVDTAFDASFEQRLTLDPADTLDDLVAAINEANVGVSAAIIDTGSGPQRYRLSLTSSASGRAGRFTVDTGGVDLGLNTLVEGRDARVLVGLGDGGGGLLVTGATNTLRNVIGGLTLELFAVSDDPVTVTVTRDDDAPVAALTALVDAFNQSIDGIRAYDFFDAEEGRRGVLFGDPTVGALRSALYREITAPAIGISGSFNTLAEIGVGIDGDGRLTLDEARLRDAIAADRAGVEALLTAYDIETQTQETIADGVTVASASETVVALGLAGRLERRLAELTAAGGGLTTIASDAYRDRIDRLGDRVDALDVRLAARRARLFAQFNAMEQALAQLQAQSNALNAIAAGNGNAFAGF